MNSWVFALVALATIITSNVIAFLRRGKDSFETYAADPNAHGTLAISLSMAGTIIGGGMFLAVGQIGFEAGVTGYVFGLTSLVGLSLTGAFASRLRKAMDDENVLSLVDLLEKRFSARVAIVFSFVSAVMYFFLLAGQFVALYDFGRFASGAIGNEWLPWFLVSIGGLSMLVYPIIGGLRKDILTDFFQVFLVVLASLFLIKLLFCEPSAQNMWATLPASHLSGTGYGTVFLIGLIIFVPGLFLVRNDVWQRIRAAKDERSIVMAFIIAGVVAFLFYLLFTTLGMWAFAANLSNSKQATLEIISQTISNPIILGLVIGAFFAAVLSSADTFINNTSLFGARLIFGKLWHNTEDNKKKQETKLLWYSRIIALLVTCIAAFIAWISRDFVDLLIGAFSLLLMFLPTVLGIVIRTWRCERGAFYGTIVGVGCFLPLFFFWDPKIAFAPSVIVSIVIYIAFCYCMRKDNKSAK